MNMRICRVTSEFPPPWDGLSPGPYQLSISQSARGAELVVIAKKKFPLEEFDRDQPFRIFRINSRYDTEFSFKAAMIVRKIGSQKPFDIIHCHGFSALGILTLRKIGIIFKPVVTSLHILRKDQISANKLFCKNRFILFQEGFCVRNSDAICAVSDEISMNVVKKYSINPDIVFPVYNGVDVNVFKPKMARKKNGLLKLLFVGVLNGRKGELVLLEACSLLSKMKAEWRLTIIGDGPSIFSVKEYINKNNLSERVVLKKYVPYNEMPVIYNNSDIFVLPSTSEGMPKVLLEAMACGCAVIASDIPGCRELIEEGENGFRIPMKSAGDLTEAILTLYRNPQLINDMGQKSRKIVEAKYTWDEVARRTEQCYEKLISK